MGGGRRYPPVCERTRSVAAIAARNTFSEGQVEGSRGAAPLRPKDCCRVDHLPTRPPKGCANTARHYFGMDVDGYVYVKARSRAALRVWPADKYGDPLPVRLVRWMLDAGQRQVVRHTCDTPSCIRRSHLILGTAGDNVADSWRRTRRTVAPPLPPPPPPVTPRAVPAPPLPPPPPQCRANDKRFCVTGYHSPGKLARKRARLALDSVRRLAMEVQMATPPPPRLTPPSTPPPPPRRNSINGAGDGGLCWTRGQGGLVGWAGGADHRVSSPGARVGARARSFPGRGAHGSCRVVGGTGGRRGRALGRYHGQGRAHGLRHPTHRCAGQLPCAWRRRWRRCAPLRARAPRPFIRFPLAIAALISPTPCPAGDGCDAVGAGDGGLCWTRGQGGLVGWAGGADHRVSSPGARVGARARSFPGRGVRGSCGGGRRHRRRRGRASACVEVPWTQGDHSSRTARVCCGSGPS